MDDKDYLQIAIKQAEKSVKQGGFPAGAVVVKRGKIISTGIGLGSKLNDPTSHPETASIRNACKVLKTSDLKGAVLYASLQPCLMCFSVANWAGIAKIVFGCKKNADMVSKGYYEGKTDIYRVNQKNNRKIELIYIPDFKNDSLELISRWESKMRL